MAFTNVSTMMRRIRHAVDLPARLVAATADEVAVRAGPAYITVDASAGGKERFEARLDRVVGTWVGIPAAAGGLAVGALVTDVAGRRLDEVSTEGKRLQRRLDLQELQQPAPER